MVNPVLSRPSEVWMLSHRSRPIGNADTSGHRILASRSTIRQADSRDRPTPGLGSWLLHDQNPEQVSEPSDGMSPTRNTDLEPPFKHRPLRGSQFGICLDLIVEK